MDAGACNKSSDGCDCSTFVSFNIDYWSAIEDDNGQPVLRTGVVINTTGNRDIFELVKREFFERMGETARTTVDLERFDIRRNHTDYGVELTFDLAIPDDHLVQSRRLSLSIVKAILANISAYFPDMETESGTGNDSVTETEPVYSQSELDAAAGLLALNQQPVDNAMGGD